MAVIYLFCFGVVWACSDAIHLRSSTTTVPEFLLVTLVSMSTACKRHSTSQPGLLPFIMKSCSLPFFRSHSMQASRANDFMNFYASVTVVDGTSPTLLFYHSQITFCQWLAGLSLLSPSAWRTKTPTTKAIQAFAMGCARTWPGGFDVWCYPRHLGWKSWGDLLQGVSVKSSHGTEHLVNLIRSVTSN